MHQSMQTLWQGPAQSQDAQQANQQQPRRRQTPKKTLGWCLALRQGRMWWRSTGATVRTAASSSFMLSGVHVAGLTVCNKLLTSSLREWSCGPGRHFSLLPRQGYILQLP